ncbi:hypothetical protein [Nostoc sp.]|uniref:hypothetical protein n=1 Tax=Nostoc sp. TaxID=1180 RepID=UPI002FFC6E48
MVNARLSVIFLACKRWQHRYADKSATERCLPNLPGDRIKSDCINTKEQDSASKSASYAIAFAESL